MILRGHRTMKIAMATLSELATMAHEAEETDDDLTTIGIMEELDVRGGASLEIFRMAYLQQWPSRATYPTGAPNDG